MYRYAHYNRTRRLYAIRIDGDDVVVASSYDGIHLFRIAEDGLAEVHHQPETAEEQAGAQEAAGGCPVAVIHVS